MTISPLNLSPVERYHFPKIPSQAAKRKILRIESSPEYPPQTKKAASQRAKFDLVPVSDLGSPKKPYAIVSSQEEPLASSPEFPSQIKRTASQRAKLEFVPVAEVESPKKPYPIVFSQEEPFACTPEMFPRKKPKLPQRSEDSIAPFADSKEVTTTTYQGSPLLGRKPSKQVSPSKSNQIRLPPETIDKTKELFRWEPSTQEILEAFERREGTLDFRNGTYVGQLQELRPHGKGTWISVHGDCYEGEWVEGEFHGEGTYVHANGNFYNGSWKEGKQNGQGVFLCPNGDSYEGEWKKGKMHGNGIGKYANGDFYQGSWEDNQHHGRGTFHFGCKGKFRGKYITFKGEYRNNERHGRFVISTPQGSQCTLDFQNGKPIPGSSRLIKLSSNKSNNGKINQYCMDKWL
ncbi:MAG: hypothetical protein LLG04_00465 [Parachlamydia sp.]|nr:hypothetical protein [Parachlamydia sp.]